MSKKRDGNLKRRLAAILAIIIAVAMVLSLAAPFLGAIAYGASTSTVSKTYTENTELDAEKVPAEINQGQFVVQGDIGFDNRYIINKTTPFKFVVANNGGADFKGEAQLKVGLSNGEDSAAIFYVPLELAKGAAKEVEINASLPTFRSFFAFSLVDENGETVFLKNNFVTPNDPQSVWTAVLSNSPSDLVYLKENDSRYNQNSQFYGVTYFDTLYFTEKNFPATVDVLKNFKMLIINDFNTAILNEEQVNAINQWVSGGGLLVLGTGVNAEKVLGGISSIAPITFTNATKTVNDGGNMLVVSDATIENAKVLTNADNSPTTTYVKVGNGTLVLHNFDLGNSPVPKIQGMAELLGGIYESVSPDTFSVDENNYTYSDSYNVVRDSAQAVEPMQGAWVDIMFAIIGIYTLFIGPVLYLILKKKDKREKGWVLIPIFAVATAIVVYAMGSTSYYRGSIINMLSRVDIQQGSSVGNAKVYVALKSGEKGDWEFRTDEKVSIIASEIGNGRYYDMNFDFEYKINVLDYSEITFSGNESWDTNTFSIEKNIELGGTLDANIVLKNGIAEGTIVNNTSVLFEDVIVEIGNSLEYIAEIQPGETIAIKQDIAMANEDISGDYYNGYEKVKELFGVEDNYAIVQNIDFAKELRSSLVAELIYQEEIAGVGEFGVVKGRIIAFNEESIIMGNKYLNGKVMNQQGHNVFISTIDIAMDMAGEEITIPFGFLKPVSIFNGNGIELQTGNSYINIRPDEEVTAMYNVPNTFEPTFMQVYWEDSNTYVEVEVFNNTTQAWEPLNEDGYTQVEGYFSEDGNLLIKAISSEYTDIMKPEIILTGRNK